MTRCHLRKWFSGVLWLCLGVRTLRLCPKKTHPSCHLKLGPSLFWVCTDTFSVPLFTLHHPFSSQWKLCPIFRLQLMRESSLSVKSPPPLFWRQERVVSLSSRVASNSWSTPWVLTGMTSVGYHCVQLPSFLLPPFPSIPLLIYTWVCMYRSTYMHVHVVLHMRTFMQGPEVNLRF